MRQWNGEPGAPGGGRPRLVCRGRRALLDPAAVTKAEDKRVVDRQLAAAGNRLAPCRGGIIADAAAQRPQHSGRAVHELGERTDDPDRELLAVFWFRDEFDEFQ